MPNGVGDFPNWNIPEDIFPEITEPIAPTRPVRPTGRVTRDQLMAFRDAMRNYRKDLRTYQTDLRGYNAELKKRNPPASAALTMAGITRDQWNDWVERFRPLETELMDQTTYNDPNLVANSVSDAMGQAGRTFDSQTAIDARSRAELGVNVGGDYQQATNRLSSLSRTASLTDAANRIRARLIDRDREIALGGQAARPAALSQEMEA
jgi:type II secretory pathway pseudopilin PulG